MGTCRKAAALALLVAATTTGLTGCGTAAPMPAPEGETSVRGILFSEGPADPTGADAVVLFTLMVDEDEYPYYWNAQLSFSFRTVITTQTGEALGLRGLSSGMVVDVWTGICRESFPVQCDVTRVHVIQVD